MVEFKPPEQIADEGAFTVSADRFTRPDPPRGGGVGEVAKTFPDEREQVPKGRALVLAHSDGESARLQRRVGAWVCQ
ncbi:hypothetical protein DB30_02991 [Enhygromyxa salina]|uniref:Uncharacterized protein n=1 Tax=Enhygromyxa salina TaxID=215803 RepID=A0A0C2D3D8_9BACT|nr:hypothetical protein DB30_02991 [Enhygromyxa salina]